jgi:hypothetical protein
MAGQADSIRGLQGFTQIPSPTIRGIGMKCVAGETGCFTTADGQPAWLIASVSYAAIQAGSATNVFLQIGERGLNHETVLAGDYDFNSAVNADDFVSWRNGFGSSNSSWADGNNDGQVNASDYVVWRKNDGGMGQVELSNLTSIRFGVGPVPGVPEPVYNGQTDRQVNLPGDHADAVIQVAMSGGGGIASVPEPTSHLVSWAGGLVALSQLRVRRPIR